MSALISDLIKHSGPPPAGDMAPNHQLQKLHTLQTLGPWFPDEIQNLFSPENRTFNSLFLLSWDKTFETLSLVQGWLDNRNSTVVAHFLNLCVVSLYALLPALLHSLWSSLMFLNRLLIFFCHPCCLYTSANSQLCQRWSSVAYHPCVASQWLSR